MFLAPFDSFHAERVPAYIDQLLSEQSLRKTGYFEPAAVHHWRKAFRTLRRGSPHRASMEMGLVGVVATQLWHHTYLEGTLADLPSRAQSRGPESNGTPSAHRAQLESVRQPESSLATHHAPGRGK